MAETPRAPGASGDGASPGPQVAGRQNTASHLSEVFGDVVGLLVRSPAHRHLFLADLDWAVAPPLMAGQCQVYRQQNTAVAYVSWALVNEEVEKRLASGVRRLAPADWRSGDRLWVIDIVAPFGGLDHIVSDLRGRVLAGREVKVLRAGPGGGPVVETWPAGEPVNPATPAANPSGGA